MTRIEPSIPQLIARATLSASHRQIADYVLDHPLKVAAMPVNLLAEKTGVSVATANRFARALGFSGYAQFRGALVRGFESVLAPVEKLRSELDVSASAADVFAATLDQTAGNIERTRQRLDAAECARAVATILAARRVFILGYGSCGWLSGLLFRDLDLYCDNVHMLASLDGAALAARLLRHVTPDDVLITLAFPRYSRETVLLTKRAHAIGASVLAITDTANSPVAGFAKIALYASTDTRFHTSSEASALALIEALSSAVAHASGRSLEAASFVAEQVLPWLHDNHKERSHDAVPNSRSDSPSSVSRKQP
jgi:DNA-binding MurR/RpiR family transcriptional regulator